MAVYPASGPPVNKGPISCGRSASSVLRRASASAESLTQQTRRGTDAQRAAPGERRAAVVDGGGGTQSASTAWRGFCDLRAPADARLAWVNARAWSDAAAAENQTPGVTRVTPNQRASPKAADLPLPAAVPLHTTPGPFGGGRRPAISVPRPRSPIVISGLRRSQQGPRVFCHADRHGTRPGRWHDAPSKSALRGGGARGAHPVSARGGVPHAETCRNGCGPRTCAPPGACRPLRADPCPVTARVRGGGGSRGARLLEGGPARAPRAIRGASARARARAEEEEDRPSWRHSLCAPSNCTQCAVPAGSTTSRIWEGDWRWGTGHAARALQRPAWLSPPPLPCWMRVRGHCAGVRRGTPFCVRACRCSSLTCCCLRDAWYGMALTLWTLQPGLLSFEASRGVW
ncbi:hypothetical protein PsYK624_045070 [Phanerochaete sordida]|uniref:Uncharacterized protein n=1 Tax=Phanerochaete sordida TaxID=48140 RepID=A0A9P3G5U9_9APHY|nr:hypothetical protein PsYK624_045070 [Phanerochaete sordida]